MRASFKIAGHQIPPGTRQTIDIPLSLLSNYTPMTLPVHVVHGRREGPTLFVSAAIHGDEILGVEIIRRLATSPSIRRLGGTLLMIPIVNAYGFISHTRQLPDRRDLNRSFPGSPQGSLAGQLAHVFMTEIVQRSNFGIDLHTGALHRSNLPQIRADLAKPGIKEMARAFGAPVVLHSNLRDGSLRQAAQEVDVDILVYEAGEALRFDEFAIRVGLKGVLAVMQHLGMIAAKRPIPVRTKPVFSNESSWLRAPAGGILRTLKGLGAAIEQGQVIGLMSDPFGQQEVEIVAKLTGIIIGRTNLPVVNQGDALFHIARVVDPEKAMDRVDRLEQEVGGDPLFDGDEII